MADGKIYIIVTDQLPNGQGPLEPDKPREKKEDKDPLGKYIQHSFFNMIQSQAKQFLSYSIANIGNFTGDYIKQQQTQNAKQFTDFALGVVNAAIAGFKISGGSPYGAVVGAVVAVAGQGISYAEQIYAGEVENRRQNLAINQLKTRAGSNSTNNGSRGTDQ